MKKLITLATALTVAATPLLASAHEHQEFEINGVHYSFTVGSLNEPVTVDDKTGVDLRIDKSGPAHGSEHEAGEDHTAGMPVVGLEETLQVELIAGDKKKVLDLSPVYGVLGAYKAPFYPTVATTLSYRVFGSIEGTPFDYTFTCSPAGHAASEEDTSRVQISDKVFRVGKSGSYGCPAEKEAQGFPEESVTLNSLQNDNSGMVAWGAGALAIIALGTAVMRRRS